MRFSGRHDGNSGSAVVIALIVMLIVDGILAAALVGVSRQTHTIHRQQASIEALNAAEAGVSKAMFILRVSNDWSRLPQKLIAITNLTAGSAPPRYTVDFVSSGTVGYVSSLGEATFGGKKVRRRVLVDVVKPPPKALGYSMFGNDIGFHNHMKATYALSISNRMWSNNDIDVMTGLQLRGAYTAVGQINLMNNPSGVSPTSYSNAVMRDGTPDSVFYAPNYGEPLPEPLAFPTYNYIRATNIAVLAGTYFSSPSAFLTYANWRRVQINADGVNNDLDAAVDEVSEREYRAVKVPNPTNTTKSIVLMEKGADGGATGISKRVTLSGFFYIKGNVTIGSGQPDELWILTNATIVTDGSVTFSGPVEFYAPTNEVGIAAKGGIKITDDVGPTHFEGLMYSESDIHVHQNEEYGSVYFGGIEIADYIHNCEYFTMEYKDYSKVNGLNEALDSETALEMRRWREVPP